MRKLFNNKRYWHVAHEFGYDELKSLIIINYEAAHCSLVHNDMNMT